MYYLPRSRVIYVIQVAKIVKRRFGVVCVYSLCVVACGCGLIVNRAFTPERASTEYFRFREHVYVSRGSLSGDEAASIDSAAKLIKGGEWSRAIASIADAQKVKCGAPSRFCTELLLLQGTALADGGLFNEAQSVFSRVIEADPTEWRARLHRWQLRLVLRDREGAELDRTAGMKLRPTVFATPYSPVGGVR